MACIIGARTKKILYLGVKNKYCFICARARSEEPPAHLCFRNWSGSSTAMESAIISEGFRKSLEMHGLIYGKVIGDGDSSVYRKLIATCPYGPTFLIEKVECRNHLLRNYINRLSDLSKDTNFPVSIRKQVTSSEVLGRYRYAVTKAISFRKKEAKPLTEKQELLRKDIVNGPSHIFGEHAECDKYFCKERTAQEKNLVPDLKLCGLYDAIMNVNRRLAQNVSSLLYDLDTNAAETLLTHSGKIGRRIEKTLFADSYQPLYLHRYENAKIRAAICKTSTHRVPRRNLFATADEHYGAEYEKEKIPDLDLEDYTEKVNQLLKN